MYLCGYPHLEQLHRNKQTADELAPSFSWKKVTLPRYVSLLYCPCWAISERRIVLIAREYATREAAASLDLLLLGTA